MNEPFIRVWIGRDKRDVLGELCLQGFAGVEDAKPAIIRYLLEEGVEGEEGGTVTHATPTDTGIDVETTACGFGVSNQDIERAIRANGGTVKLWN